MLDNFNPQMKDTLSCSGARSKQTSGIKKGAGVEKGKTQENLKFLDSVSSLEPACFWKKKKKKQGWGTNSHCLYLKAKNKGLLKITIFILFDTELLHPIVHFQNDHNVRDKPD